MADRERATRIAGRLREAGHEALFAGGSVRDALLERTPRDYDVATSATPDQVQALFERTVAVGAAFGVIMVVDGDAHVEVATFREDVGVLDGRHPKSVRYVDAKADALRRDFTINGMFEDPETGEILDFVGGRADLEARVVRSIGDPVERFREDRLRILRAVRFATVLDFTIEPRTRAAVDAHAADIAHVSAERIRDELTRILVSGRGGRGLGLLHATGLLAVILPEVAAMDGVLQPPQFHPEGDVLTHTRMLLDGLREPDEVVALAALLHDVAKPTTACINDKGRIAFPEHAPRGADMADEILRRLRYKNSVIERVHALIRRHMDWPSVPKMRPAKRKRFLMQDDFDLHLELHRLDCLACHRDLSIHEYAILERERLDAEPPPVRPVLSGRHLKTMGFEPGPAFRVMLDALLDAQLEERVEDAEDARRFILERFRPPDGRPVATDPPS